jgi:hypothetical protein
MLFKSKSNYYYSNSTELSNPAVVINVLEDAVASYIDANQGKWTKKHSPISLSAKIDGGVLSAEITCDPKVFNYDAEYAFYIKNNGVKIYTQWYTYSPFLSHALEGSITQKSISVTGFVRENGNQDKGISVTVSAS